MTIKNQNASDSKIESSYTNSKGETVNVIKENGTIYTNDKSTLDWLTDKPKDALLKKEISQIIKKAIDNNKNEILSEPNTEIAVKNILKLYQNEINNKIAEYITK